MGSLGRLNSCGRKGRLRTERGRDQVSTIGRVGGLTEMMPKSKTLPLLSIPGMKEIYTIVGRERERLQKQRGRKEIFLRYTGCSASEFRSKPGDKRTRTSGEGGDATHEEGKKRNYRWNTDKAKNMGQEATLNIKEQGVRRRTVCRMLRCLRGERKRGGRHE